MLSQLLKSKLHHLRVTSCSPEYQGSLMIDEALMDAAGIANWEKLLVANLENGKRFETYAIAGKRGSGVACLNGAAASKGRVGDRLIVMTFALLENSEIATHRPKVVVLDEKNKPRKQ
ncbi:MAG: aspartate 1-decarboxylase [Kiritimatiellae bacterium]|jgi:aspartate 1-decarboxylase|nr:aspartate 1-decarboxylase [Kiritimatiellia bacterium]